MKPEKSQNQFIEDLHFITLGCGVVGVGAVIYGMLTSDSSPGSAWGYVLGGNFIIFMALGAGLLGLILTLVKRNSLQRYKYYLIVYLSVLAVGLATFIGSIIFQ